MESILQSTCLKVGEFFLRVRLSYFDKYPVGRIELGHNNKDRFSNDIKCPQSTTENMRKICVHRAKRSCLSNWIFKNTVSRTELITSIIKIERFNLKIYNDLYCFVNPGFVITNYNSSIGV